MTAITDGVEDVDSFRGRARDWLAANMPRLGDVDVDAVAGDRRRIDRGLQRRLWDGGFAGICFPREYGGLGLTPEHQRAFTAESLPYEMPFTFNVPTLSILAATLVDFGTETQKRRHLPAILRGEELWVQFLSEPTGGSDLAGCLTRADRDGDVFIVNGSKIWSSGAHRSDYAMLLARTDWDVPKHRGLTMFIVKIHQPGIQVETIRQSDGTVEFCQEFFDDVVVPLDDVVGEMNDGWTVATRLLVHERNAVGGGSPYTSGRTVGPERAGPDRDLVHLALAVGREHDPHVRQLVAEMHTLGLVGAHLVTRVTKGTVSGKMPPPAGAILKLFTATAQMRRAEVAVDVAQTDAVTWPSGEPAAAARSGSTYLSRQLYAIGGGTNEMQRNIISERLLGMPREPTGDADRPYRDVRRNAMPTTRRDR